MSDVLRLQVRLVDFIHLLLNAGSIEVTFLGCSKAIVGVRQFCLSLASAQAPVHRKANEFVKAVCCGFQRFLIVIIERTELRFI